MFFESEATDEEKFAQANFFEAMWFEKAVYSGVSEDHLFKCPSVVEGMALEAIAAAITKSLNLRMQALSLDDSDDLELALKYKEGGNFYMKHKHYYMAIFMYTLGGRFAQAQSDVEATLFNNLSACAYFLKLYDDSLDTALHALAINPLYGKARRRAAECALITGQFCTCQVMCEKLLEQNQYTAEAGSLLARAQLGAEEARKALEFKPEFKRLCEVLRERGVKFSKHQDACEIYEHMLKPTCLPLRNSRVHLAEDGVTLVWPILFAFVGTEKYHCEHKVSETITMKNLLRKIMAGRTFASGIQLNLRKCYVYYMNTYTQRLQKVNVRKSIKGIVNEEEFYLRAGCLLFVVSKNVLGDFDQIECLL